MSESELRAEVERLRDELASVRHRCLMTDTMICTWIDNIHAGAASFDKEQVIACLHRLSDGLKPDTLQKYTEQKTC